MPSLMCQSSVSIVLVTLFIRNNTVFPLGYYYMENDLGVAFSYELQAARYERVLLDLFLGKADNEPKRT